MLKFDNRILLATILSFSTFLGGCQLFTDSFESAALLDQEGKSSKAIVAYQKYLEHHPASLVASKICYRIAKNYESQSDYSNALNWYEKILKEYPRTDEELHALLDMAALYHDKLKNNSKAMEYDEKAFNRYMDNVQMRDALQALIDAQYQTATVFFSQKVYKNAADTLDGIYKTYPVALISPDTRAKIDYLSDRSRRALTIAKASVDSIILRSEIPFNKSNESDFMPANQDDDILPSPDGGYLAERKKGPKGVYYLYVAKVPVKDDKAVFNLVPQTFGADKPTWSPDGRELVYWRVARGRRKLEKTNIKTKITQTLFYTKSNSLGIHPAYHPAGNKIVYVYEKRVCLINVGDNFNKQLLKTNLKLDYTADLTWSMDGTMVRCRQTTSHGKAIDELLVLDVSNTNSP